MPSAITNFKDKIENLPTLLRTALERRAKARIAVARFEAQLTKLKAQLALQSDEEDENGEGVDSEIGANELGVGPNPLVDDGLENDSALTNLESKLEHLKLELTEAEDKAEIDFRASENRVTESYVKAAVGTNVNVSRLRREVLQAKEAVRMQKVVVERERQSSFIERQQSRMSARFNMPIVVEDQKLVDLREKLAEAREELILAEVEVEVANVTVETYKMLSQNQ